MGAKGAVQSWPRQEARQERGQGHRAAFQQEVVPDAGETQGDKNKSITFKPVPQIFKFIRVFDRLTIRFLVNLLYKS